MPQKPKRDTRSQQDLPAPDSSPSQIILSYLILAAIILLFSFIRIRIAPFPLERDEGEYAYFGQLILQGIPPYQLAYNLKFPGIYAVYGLIMAVFGQTIEGIHFGLLLFNIGSLCLIFFIAKRLFSRLSAAVAVAISAILFLSPDLLGQSAHATHFVTFFMLAGCWLLLRGMETGKRTVLFLAGIMMALSLLMKQSGVFFPLFGVLMLILSGRLRKENTWRRILAPLVPYVSGFFAAMILSLLILYLCGVFNKFWFWTWIYPKVYSSRIPISQVWTSFSNHFPPVLHSFTAAWILAGLGGIALFFYRGKVLERLFLGMLLIFSFLCTVPGFYFRPHYFIPMAPAIGMLAGFLLEFLDQRIGQKYRLIRWVPALIMAALVVLAVNANRMLYFKADPVQLCHMIYQDNDFVEAVPIARYIEENSGEAERILVFGSEPEIYFYAKRKSATGYIYMYDFGFAHPYKERMQKELILEVEKSSPKFLVAVSYPNSWTADPGEADALFRWFSRYAQQNNYIPVGLVNYQFPGPSEYLWGEEAESASPHSRNYIYILQHKGTDPDGLPPSKR